MSEAKWIVKSSGRIIGPMTIENIVEAMRAKTFSVLDEVREPQTRWTFLREHPLLMPVVRQIRDEQSSGMENTQSTFVTSGRTVTSSVTERIMEEAELTPNPTTPAQPQMKSIAAVEKNVAPSASGAKSFGVLTDQKVQQQLQKQTSQWRNVLYGLGALALVGAGVYYKMQAGSGMSNVVAAEKVKFATDRAKRGDFALAIRTVQEIETAKGLSPEEKLLKAKLLLSQEPGNPIELKKTVDELTQEGVGGADVSVEMLQGLVQTKLDNYPDAVRHFEAVVAKNPHDEKGLLNLAAAAWKGRMLAKASKLMSDHDAEKSKPSENSGRERSSGLIQQNVAYFQLLRGLIALGFGAEKGGELVQQSAYAELENFTRGMQPLSRSLRSNKSLDEYARDAGDTGLARGADSSCLKSITGEANVDCGRELRFERMLVRSLLARRLGKTDEYMNHLKELVQTSPFESARYMKTPLLFWGAFEWRSAIRPLCNQLGNRSDSLVQAAYALCIAPTDGVGALTEINAAMAKSPGVNLVTGARFMIYLENKRLNEVGDAALKYTFQDELSILWVKAMVQEQRNDWPGAERTWQDYIAIDRGEPRAYYGLALAANGLSKMALQEKAVNQGYRFASNYAPLMEFREMDEKY